MNQFKLLKKVGVMAIVTLILSTFILVPQQSEIVQAAAKPKINKQSVRLIKGQTTKLKLNGAKGKVKWKSNKKAVATVSKKGMVKARKKGNAKITANYAGKTYKCKVWVETPKISKTTLALEVGKTENLTLHGTKQKVTWSSKQPEIAEVNNTGTVVAKSAGNTIIKATVGKNAYTCTVTVKEINVQSQVTDTKPQQPEEIIKNPEEVEVQPENSEDNNTELDTEIRMYMESDEIMTGNVITTGHSEIIVMIENNSSETITICEGYRLEKKVGEQWQEVPMSETIDEETDDIILRTGTKAYAVDKLPVPVAEGYTLEFGEYRIIKIAKRGKEKIVLTEEFSYEQGILMVSMVPTGSCVIPTSQTTFEVRMENYSNMPIDTYSPCKLEKFVENKWVEWDLGWIRAESISRKQPNAVWTCEISLAQEYEEGKSCEPGKYRVKTWFEAGNQRMDGYVCFEIVE
ncbi:MAG: Ig-like domain-containing protein [Lachnospiraceae bacterium]|nr:Ig-like domain-containing protein [Lachnospiraceae bacterium]